ncbi:tail fiber assembly protein, partial [Escherichia coli]|nr:tail fiber assembly protein [Escherichia coli]
MKPVCDENGLATEPGEIRCYYYDIVTFEYIGWSDEYINIGVSMPGNSTDIDPGNELTGKVAVFENGGWVLKEDHRGKTVYSTTDGMPHTIDYIGPINNGYT